MRTTLLASLLILGSSQAMAKTVTIAVIDTGIDKNLPHLCKMGHKSFFGGDPLHDSVGHGTHVAGLINRNAVDGDYCMVALQYYREINTGKENLANMVAAIKHAIAIKVDFINISGGGPEFAEQEYLLIKSALDKGIQVVVAAGNEGDDLGKWCNYFPACYDPRVIRVGNLEEPDKLIFKQDFVGPILKRKPASSSNFGKPVNRWEMGTNVESDLPRGRKGRMSGTSMATAIATGKLVKAKLDSRK